jgi:hypothetical protein
LYIPLTKNTQNTIYAVANLSDKNKVLQYNYHIKDKNGKLYAKTGYLTLHEIVMGKKAKKGFVIDHIDSDGLNNTKENLQFASKSLNAQNRAKKPNCSSQYIGVIHKDSKINPWCAKIRINNKIVNLGRFKNEIDAAKMYDVYAIDHYREYQPKTNDLLTKTEIQDILQNGIPEKYKLTPKIQALYKNIKTYKNGSSFNVIVNRDNKHIHKTVKTLEEAIILRDKIFKENDDLKQAKEAERIKHITKNEEGICIIMVNGIECTVDEHVWADVSQNAWYYRKNSDGTPSYPQGTVDGKLVLLHRYIYETYVGEIPDNMTVDHVISTNIFDVRLDNLRLADPSLQNHNKIITKKSLDIYRGVSFQGNVFKVNISHIHYGSFDTAEKAAEKANEIYTLKYGKNALLNKIDYTTITTKDSRIPDNIITKDFIMNLKSITDLKNLINKKTLDSVNGGSIYTTKITRYNFEEHKQIVADLLFPPTKIII